jgi:glycosyltransferase involved in cell wall biosynthesis
VKIIGPHPPAALTSRTSEGVEVTGYVRDVRPLLASAAAFVAPITFGSGIRNKILEAMAMGLPVVATPMACEGIQVEAGQNVLLGRDSAELAAAAIRVLRDDGLRRRIAKGSIQLMRRQYNWRHVAAQYEQIYDQIRAEHGAR